MTPPLAQPVSDRPRADVPSRSQPTGSYVVNLCSSTTPMALSQPQDPTLKRFTFFVSRRLEDGRERFRLHMGHFDTLEEAEEWVSVAREFYPGAWAGEAPGKRLREHAQPPVAASAARPAAPQPRADVAARPAAASASRTEVAAPRGAASAPHTEVAGSRGTAAARRSAAPAARAVALPDSPPPNRDVPVLHAAPAERRAAEASAAVTCTDAVAGLSNVREVLASLDETQATREMPRFAAPRVGTPESPKSLSDSQVLRVLEGRGADGERSEPQSHIELLKPDDTGTRHALKEAVAADAPVSFVVQLQWSVQPIDASKVPPLAIFGAYTLYTVEGSREGRRWYGLRLGFFSDAISAKQVAYYVRSEFNSVAVVPVSPQERSRVTDGETGTAPTAASHASAVRSAGPHDGEARGSVARSVGPKRPAAPRSPVRERLPEPTVEFKLIDDEPRVPPMTSPAPAKALPAPAPRRASKSSGPRVRARERRSPQTLEETLEILGADQLEIDQRRPDGSGKKTGQPRKPQAHRNSPFTKLLDRLSEKGHRER